jgi:hypothetical protein
LETTSSNPWKSTDPKDEVAWKEANQRLGELAKDQDEFMKRECEIVNEKRKQLIRTVEEGGRVLYSRAMSIEEWMEQWIGERKED